MLPSTGYFKGINCPFYDGGLCERPYCHFRHVKKESSANGPSDGIESGAILQKLVSAAVQKVLQQTESSAVATTTQQVAVEDDDTSKVNIPQSKPTYNPTPIAELNKIVSTEIENDDEQRKRHIPVPYTPRKPASLPVKRPIESNGSSKPFVFIPPTLKYTPGCTESMILDVYTPKGSIESGEKYLPGNEAERQEYTPKETHVSNKHNYVPSDRSISKKKVLEYKPTKVNNKSEKSIVTYQPTPKSLVPCFSSDEDEPDSKKMKFLHDLNGLDDLGPEFDILDQILDEEKFDCNNRSGPEFDISDQILDEEKFDSNNKSKNEDLKNTETNNDPKNTEINDNKKVSKNHKENNKNKDPKNTETIDNKKISKNHKENNKKHKKSSHKTDEKKMLQKSEDKKSEEILNVEIKNKSSVSSKTDSKAKDSDRKGHKSSSKDKEQKKERADKEGHSKNIDKSLKHSKHSSSKSSESHSKNSSSLSSKHELKKKDKSDHKSSKSLSKDKHKHDKDKYHKDKHEKDKHYEDKNDKEKHDKAKHNEEHKNTKKNKHKKDKHLTNNNFSDTYDQSHDAEDTLFNHNDELLETSESDEESIALECKKIFEEYVPCDKASSNNEFNSSYNLLDSNKETEYIPSKKRISRTADKNIKVLPREPLKKDFKTSAAQTMAERLAKVKEFHSFRTAHTSSNEIAMQRLELPKATQNLLQPTKIRIAHVPYASTMVNAKKTIAPITKLKIQEPSTSSTVIQTVKKGAQRVAHIPCEKFIDRPGVLEPLASKIPANIRSTYLNMMIDECLKIYLSATDAYARAEHEELITSKKCSTVQIYKNSAVLTVSRLRKEFQECNGVKKSGSDCSTLQKHAQTLSGKTGNIGSWSIESKKTANNSMEFIGAKFYKNIQKWVLTEQQLQENGFPRPHVSGEKGRAIIYGQNKQMPPKGLIRTCCRCKKDYIVDKKGFPAIAEECIYHPNNKYRVRGEAKYQCCSQDSSSDGCCVAPCHVYEYVDFENLKGFIKTMPPDSDMDDYGVYSLDCEMCYTTHGLDLTRVTVINSACKVVYETLIKPLHPIIDYNTRYSGITEEQMANVKTTLLEVQATLLSMFTSKTILVGHSLESDFKALKLIHDTVIDTSVLFPHKMGPPFKRALRNLSSEYLKKIIQNSVDGHDSAEDATVCMELLTYKLKEDLKTR